MHILRWCGIPAFSCLATLGTVLAPAARGDDPVKVTAEINATSDPADHYRLEIQMKIADGWHAYADVPPGEPSIPTKVSITVPEGVETVGDLQLGESLPAADNPLQQVYEGTVKFSQLLRKTSNSVSGDVSARVSYQICDDRMCRPPASSTVSVGWPKPAGKLFAEPQMLFVGDIPLNKAARQMYPSPAVYDVDNDGTDELIVGDIFGSLNVYENESSSGSPVWSKHSALKSADGQPIKVSNW